MNRQTTNRLHNYVAMTFAMALPLVSVAGADRVDYDRDVGPVLAAKCFRCHGPEKQESGLRLDVRSRALAGGDGGVAIVSGKSADSELIRRVVSSDETFRMPPKGQSLTASQVKLLRSWIDQGAKGIPQTSMISANRHWAFQPIRQPSMPPVSNAAWSRNAIDRFVLAKLEKAGIEPSPEAPRETLIRRLYLDLIGLPPPWERVAAFIADRRPNAYELLVDELLASPRYGERWGRHWLDLARYADSTGYESDKPREIWAYRDWVIKALNADMPFDQFVTEQLAGDLLASATVDQRIATGFHCNAMLDPGVRHESIIDRLNTTGAVFLGLTIGCAQCHTHKTDPLTHREFYQLYAFFNEAHITQMKMDGSFYTSPQEPASPSDETKSSIPKPTTTLVMKHAPQPTSVFIRGDHANPGDRVETGFPVFLNGRTAGLPPNGTTKLTRLDLARWLLASDNPLTARVTVNRIWQRFFAVGLVGTESDFGVQTAEPLHRELLDYLAVRLRPTERANESWSGMKPLHYLIVTSATYRQSSDTRTDLATTDPGNRFLARQTRIRLEAELIRDVSLASGGLLSNRIGGPSVFPRHAVGILQNRATPATWTTSKGDDRYRRGMYTWVWRLTPHPNLPLFDAPDGVAACTRRDRSNVAVQALTLLNDPSFVEAARSLAIRIIRADAHTDSDRIAALTRLCLSRDPTPPELKLLEELISNQRQAFIANPGEARAIARDATPPKYDVADIATWIVASRVVMNLDEFTTRE